MTIVKINILNRYILRKFLTPFIASFAALCVLLLVSLVFDRLDRFLAEGVGWKHVLGYLVTAMPLQAIQVLPVACLLGTLFVVGNLARTREYIAGLAGGLPPERFLSGIFFAGLVISLLSLLANETFVPVATRYSAQVFREKIRRLGAWAAHSEHNLIVAGADGRIWTCVLLTEENATMKRVIVDTFVEGRIVSQIDANWAQRKPDGWLFSEGVYRTFDSVTFAVVETQPFEQRLFAFDEKPSDFLTQEPDADEMNYKQLRRHIRRLSSLGIPVRKLEVELMMKISFPFTCFIVTFLGIPLALGGKGSRAMGIAAGGALTLAYLGFTQFGKALGQRLIAPWAGAWLGNVVFFAIAIYLWRRMRQTA